MLLYLVYFGCKAYDSVILFVISVSGLYSDFASRLLSASTKIASGYDYAGIVLMRGNHQS